MMKLAMTALHSNLKPPICLKQVDQFFYLHAVESTTFLFLSRITFALSGVPLQKQAKDAPLFGASALE